MVRVRAAYAGLLPGSRALDLACGSGRNAVYLALAGMQVTAVDILPDALEQALYARQPQREDGLVCHSDRGSQYLAIRYTERLAEAGIEPSVGSTGDSYDNALA